MWSLVGRSEDYPCPRTLLLHRTKASLVAAWPFSLENQRTPPPGRIVTLPPFWTAHVHPIGSSIFLHSCAISNALATVVVNIKHAKMPTSRVMLPPERFGSGSSPVRNPLRVIHVMREGQHPLRRRREPHAGRRLAAGAARC